VNLLPAAELRAAPPPRWTLTIDPDVSLRLSDHLTATLGATIPLAGALSAEPAIGVALAGGW
jgi:hypothetical protein